MVTWVNGRRTLVAHKYFLAHCLKWQVDVHCRSSGSAWCSRVINQKYKRRFRRWASPSTTVRKEDESKRQKRPIAHGSTVSDDNLTIFQVFKWYLCTTTHFLSSKILLKSKFTQVLRLLWANYSLADDGDGDSCPSISPNFPTRGIDRRSRAPPKINFANLVAHISKFLAFQSPTCYSPIALPLLICFFNFGILVFYTLIHTFQFICDFHAHICLICYFLSRTQTSKMAPK